MIRSLKEVMKAQSYCEILFADGDTINGFVTKVTEDDFDIVTLEPVLPEPTPENSREDDEGNVHYKHPESIDCIPVKHSYMNGMVYGVVSDITHRMKPSIVKSLDFIRTNQVYKKGPRLVIKNVRKKSPPTP